MNLNKEVNKLNKVGEIFKDLMSQLTKEEREQFNRFLERAKPLVKNEDTTGIENLKNNIK